MKNGCECLQLFGMGVSCTSTHLKVSMQHTWIQSQILANAEKKLESVHKASDFMFIYNFIASINTKFFH